MSSPASHIYGPIFIGVFFDLCLFGIVITQVFNYYTTYKRDPILLKLCIAILLILSFANAILNNISLYLTFIAHFNDPMYLQKSHWVSIASPTFMGATAFIVQLFFSWRIQVLLSSTACVIFVAITSLCQLLGGIGTTIASIRVDFASLAPPFEAVRFVWMGCSIAANIAITGALIFYLLHSNTSLPRKDSLFDKFVRLILHTGMVSAVISIVQLVTDLTSPPSITLLFSLSLPNLYIISLVSTLNSRKGWKISQTARHTSPASPIGGVHHWTEDMDVNWGAGRATGRDLSDTTDRTEMREPVLKSDMIQLGSLQNFAPSNEREKTPSLCASSVETIDTLQIGVAT